MGKDAIVEKLGNELATDIRSESQVVYILVEIRKLIDLDETADDYTSLAFHCSWALHVKMSRKEAQRVLKYFDEAYPHFALGKEIEEIPGTLRSELEKITQLRLLKRDLAKFFERYDLPNNLIADQWPFFLHYYAQVIADCPLVLKPPEGEGANIDRVVVTHELAHTLIQGKDVAHQLFRVIWTCYDRNGNCGTIEIHNTYPVPKQTQS